MKSLSLLAVFLVLKEAKWPEPINKRECLPSKELLMVLDKAISFNFSIN
jgi:hypothetical protein